VPGAPWSPKSVADADQQRPSFQVDVRYYGQVMSLSIDGAR
jgi:hypothetical protein